MQFSLDIRLQFEFKKTKFQGNEEDETEETDDYNKFMKELSFEPKKAKAQDRLKTDEEIITDQKDSLEKMEEIRQKRMRGEDIEENEQDEQGEENEQNEQDGENEQNEQGEENEQDEQGEEEEEEGSEDDQFSGMGVSIKDVGRF